METLAIIGCGGSGGWVVQLLAKSPKQELNLILCDADRWSLSNYDRCMMRRSDVGKLKVATAYDLLTKAGWANVEPVPRYLAPGTDDWTKMLELPDPLRILVCVDNHPARVTCLRLADARHAAGRVTVVVLTGNEYVTAGVDVYLPRWINGPLDPRVRYPEILKSTEGDPLRPPCTGEALASSPQLALYNSLSGISGLWLMDVWAQEEPKFRGDELHETILNKLPVSVQWTATGQKTLSYNEVCNADYDT
jgi:hypothetical protein